MNFLIAWFAYVICSVVAIGYMEKKFENASKGLINGVCIVLLGCIWPTWVGRELYEYMHPSDAENPSVNDKEGES